MAPVPNGGKGGASASSFPLKGVQTTKTPAVYTLAKENT